MLVIRKEKLYNITIKDINGVEHELSLTKDQASELYGKIGAELTKDYVVDVQEFFKKSKDLKGDEKACDAISDLEISSPDIDLNEIYNRR